MHPTRHGTFDDSRFDVKCATTAWISANLRPVSSTMASGTVRQPSAPRTVRKWTTVPGLARTDRTRFEPALPIRKQNAPTSYAPLVNALSAVDRLAPAATHSATAARDPRRPSSRNGADAIACIVASASAYSPKAAHSQPNAISVRNLDANHTG